MKSKRRADSAPALDLRRDLPTTPEDVAALSRWKEGPVPDLLERINELSAPDLFAPPLRRTTSAGWKPFTL